MLSLDAKETAHYLPIQSLIETLRRGFAEGCHVPPRHHHTIRKAGDPDATLLLMPAWHEEARSARYLGIKIVTVFPGNSGRGIPGLTSTYILYDANDGTQLAVLDGNAITAYRTVAASALAADYLARQDATDLLIVGSGKVAAMLPEAYSAVRQIRKVTVWNHNEAGARRLASELSENGYDVTVADDLERAVQAADIVSAATLATEPLISGRWLRPGIHVDLIGGFTPVMREIDDEGIRRSSVFVDVREALHESDDLYRPLHDGVISEADIQGTLSDLCASVARGRTHDDAITLYKAVGTALADLSTATMI